MDMDALQAKIGEWASKTYPNSTLDSKIAHLHKEVEELRTPDPLEIADCVMILMHEAHRRGHSIADLIEKKFAICQKRKLGPPDAQGVVEHIREPEELFCTLCNKPTREYCAQIVCRACHKTESLEDCVAHKQANAVRAQAGLPPLVD